MLRQMIHGAEDNSQYASAQRQQCEFPHSNALIFSSCNFKFELKEPPANHSIDP
jgi:hypothetical protein